MTIQEMASKEPHYLQRLLRIGGFPCGKIDGIVGAKTRAAMKGWLDMAAEIREELGSYDDRTESNLATLTPHCQRMARIWLAECAKAKITGIKIICGTRTYGEQAAIYAQGRTAPGAIVTKAKAGQSNHNFGVAFDFVIFEGKEPNWEHKNTAKAGKLAEKIGLEWGGSWKFVDTPHVQLTGTNIAGLRKEFESA